MRGVLGHTEINVSHYIHRTNRPQTSRLINIRPGRMCSVYRDYFLRRLVTSADTWREDWSISCWSKHSGTQLLCYWTEVFVFWQRSHLDIYFMFNTWFLILNTRLLSLLILNTEVNDSFTDYTLWVFTGAMSVKLNKLNKRKPNPVFENQPLYKCDNEVKHSALCCEATSIFLQRLPFVHKEQNVTLKWSEWFLLLLRILQEYSSLIVMRVRQTELSASQASSQTIKTENDGYFSVWSAAVREIWNRTECLLTSETRFRIVWGSWIQATNVINRLKSDNTDSHPLK